MSGVSWPRENELNEVKEIVSAMAGRGPEEVRVVVSPYRICPLGAHIDHQGGTVSAMTINKGILLGFIPSDDTEVIRPRCKCLSKWAYVVVGSSSHQVLRALMRAGCGFLTCTTVDSIHVCRVLQYLILYVHKSRFNDCYTSFRTVQWRSKVQIFALIQTYFAYEKSKFNTSKLDGVDKLQQPKPIRKKGEPHATDSPKLQETDLSRPPQRTNHLEEDRASKDTYVVLKVLIVQASALLLLLIENEYLGLKNGILDQSAILLSSHGFLTHMNCKTKEHKLIPSPKLNDEQSDFQKSYKILLAFSGLKNALTNSPGYNLRVVECHEAARILLNASGNDKLEPRLCNGQYLDITIYFEFDSSLFYCIVTLITNLFFLTVDPEAYDTHKPINLINISGLEAWASGNLKEFGKLISASGLSSIQNYECGCEPLKQLYEILLKAPGVYGTRFSGAGFRGCCLAFVDANLAEEAVTFVTEEYRKAQPKLANQIVTEKAALICEAGDCAHFAILHVDFATNMETPNLSISLFFIVLYEIHRFCAGVAALNIGVQTADSAISLGKGCSRKCESEFCSVPPFLRYGKYCGLLYSGCPGEKPCDGLDACCMKHDACIQAKNNDYLSQECSQKFISCMNHFKAGARTFKGNKCKVNEVIEVISVVMEAALLAGRALHKP
ncbi:hypothetical protein SADUNF_Sadunf06G0052800 [Salix dunnii]|uniref:phospholipase A2 n=1 Tax=Salix dunnii TaxID=1413687 RepID=A0A835JYF4_9ROSI|nr:hypothetical protein SADUNF_Sadunf06G0052800 [Salix dunnii]